MKPVYVRAGQLRAEGVKLGMERLREDVRKSIKKDADASAAG